jgi:hypothetical protein
MPQLRGNEPILGLNIARGLFTQDKCPFYFCLIIVFLLISFLIKVFQITHS